MGLYVLTLVIAAIIAFFLGSTPSALIIGKGLYNVDVREHGSGNTGSTNVTRVIGLKAGLIVFALDLAKGIAAVWIAIGLAYLFEALFLDPAFAGKSMLTTGETFLGVKMDAALFAILGHMFSPFQNFKGGKGIATTFAALTVALPPTAWTALGVFIIVVLISKYVSLGSIFAAITTFVSTCFYYTDHPVALCVTFVIMVLLLVKHRANFKRLINHEESKFSIGHRDKDAGESGAEA
jgi:glycerol-3-phosphate acyltransferase PlsY